MIVHLKKEVYLNIEDDERAKRILSDQRETEIELDRAEFASVVGQPVDAKDVPPGVEVALLKAYLG